MESQLVEHKSAIDALEAERDSLLRAKYEMERAVERLAEEAQALELNITEHSGMLASQTQQLGDATREVNELRERLRVAESQASEAESKAEELAGQVASAQAECDRLRQELKAARVEGETLRVALAAAEERVEEERASAGDAMTSLYLEQEKVKGLEGKLTVEEDKVKALAAGLVDESRRSKYLNRCLAKTNRSLTKSRALVFAKDDEIHSLRGDVSALMEEKVQLNKDLHVVITERDMYEGQEQEEIQAKEKVEQECEQLRVILQSTEEEVKRERANTGEVTAKLDAEKEKTVSLQSQLDDHIQLLNSEKENASATQSKLTDATQRLDTEKEKTATLQSELDDQTRLLDTEKDKSASLQSQLDDRAQLLDTEKDKNATLQSQLDDHADRLDARNTEIGELSSQISELHATVDASNERIETLQREKDLEVSAKNSAMAERDETNARLLALLQELEQVKAHAQLLVDTNTELRAFNAALERCASDLQNRNNDLVDCGRALENQLHQERNTTSHIRADVDNIQTCSARVTVKNKVLKRQLLEDKENGPVESPTPRLSGKRRRTDDITEEAPQTPEKTPFQSYNSGTVSSDTESPELPAKRRRSDVFASTTQTALFQPSHSDAVSSELDFDMSSSEVSPDVVATPDSDLSLSPPGPVVTAPVPVPAPVHRTRRTASTSNMVHRMVSFSLAPHTALD